MTHKELHNKINRRIVSIEEPSSKGLSGRPTTCTSVVTQCMSCLNQFMQFFYDDDISDLTIGDKLPGGQQIANAQF